MTPAVASLLALLAAIAISFASRVNVGLIAIPLAWAVGAYAGKPAETIVAGFSTSLFLTLTGVTLLFSLAQANGTIAQLATRLTAAAGRHARLLPPMFFVIACVLSTLGPGAIPAVALVAPLALATAAPARISPFLTSLMVGNGANAGNLSPFSAVGIIANTRMAAIGLGGHELKVWAANFLAHAIVAAAAYAVLAGRIERMSAAETTVPPAVNRAQWITVVIVLVGSRRSCCCRLRSDSPPSPPPSCSSSAARQTRRRR
jgi:hypothetical protein